jgi:hypothetical protein
VDRRTAGEVDRREVVGDPASDVLLEAEVEDPVRDGEVDDRRPHAGEDQPGAELGAVGDGAADERHRDDREDGLEADEGHGGQAAGLAGHVLHQALQPEVLEGIAEQAGADVVAECHRVAVEHPQHADQGQRAEAHHHHVQNALRADHAAVEERETWGHQQHERGAGEDPGGVAGVDHGNLLWGHRPGAAGNGPRAGAGRGVHGAVPVFLRPASSRFRAVNSSTRVPRSRCGHVARSRRDDRRHTQHSRAGAGCCLGGAVATRMQ